MWSWVALNHSTQQTPLMSLNSMTSRLIHLIQFWHRTIFIFSPDLNNKKHGTPRGPKGHPPKNYIRSYGEWGVFNLSRSRPWVSEARWNSLGLDIRKVSFTSKICTKRNSSHDIFRYRWNLWFSVGNQYLVFSPRDHPQGRADIGQTTTRGGAILGSVGLVMFSLPVNTGP